MHRTHKGRLGKMARRRLEAGLRAMTGEREQIARLMEFAVVHADSVDEVADIICQSLKIEGTAVPRKLARLYLISDILHNSVGHEPSLPTSPIYTDRCRSGRLAAKRLALSERVRREIARHHGTHGRRASEPRRSLW